MATTKNSLPILPEWFTEGVVSSFRAGISSVFILHGDVTCLVPNPNGEVEPKYPYIPLQELFARVFDEREMVIFYNIATGMRFLRPEMEKEFRKIADPGSTEEAPKDPVAAAKADLAAKRQFLIPVPFSCVFKCIPDAALNAFSRVMRNLNRNLVLCSFILKFAKAFIKTF